MTVNILESNNLILFFAFIMPGFISLKAYELLSPQHPSDIKNQLLNATTYSCIYYALFIFPILWFENSNLKESVAANYLFYISILLIVPALWAFFWKKCRISKIGQKIFSHPLAKPWDFVFQQRDPFWVIIELKDGTKIGGLYSEKSFSSNSPADEQIYLEQRWNLNEAGGLEKKRESTKGIIISASEIKYIEFLELEYNNPIELK